MRVEAPYTPVLVLPAACVPGVPSEPYGAGGALVGVVLHVVGSSAGGVVTHRRLGFVVWGLWFVCGVRVGRVWGELRRWPR